jgi:hypothetical protein
MTLTRGHHGGVTDESVLGVGWTIERVRELEPSALLLDPAEHYVVHQSSVNQAAYEELRPAAILSFSGLCLVREVGSTDWWMGELDETDGSIACWAAYGDDLAKAIRAL